MSDEEIRAKVRDIVREQFGLPADKVINDTDRLMDDLGGDDLDVIELVMSIEEAYTIEVTDEEIYACGDCNATIGALIDVTIKHVRANA